MPTSTRRQAQAQLRLPIAHSGSPGERRPGDGMDPVMYEDLADGAQPQERSLEDAGDVGEAEEYGHEMLDEHLEPEPFPPPGLKEISSLASWTVSSAKPGNGVAALRSPDTSQFWQSDGPQPHLLSIHFFKLVSIVHMRIFLDFENDESYTPTKMHFLAGMGVHDLQEFAEMTFEQPTGWIDVDFSNVGPVDNDDFDMDDGDAATIDWSKQPVLRAFLVQIKISENHQNGKDTHLRAVQLFARDESDPPSRPDRLDASTHALPSRGKDWPTGAKEQGKSSNNIALAAWMRDAELR